MLSDAKLVKLVTDVGRLLTDAKNHATVDGKLVESYWKVGKRAHLFYSTCSLDVLETFARGHYLNQQLLDEKLAMRMR